MAGGVLAGGANSLNLKDANGNAISTTTAQTAGGVAIIFGIIMLLVGVVAIIGAVGVIKSVRWGLMLTFVLGIIAVLLSVVPFNPIGLVIGLFEAIYCGLRLFGNVGPKAA